MTADPVLVLAWLALAHLVADFLLQTEAMVTDKFSLGRRAWRGLLAHGAAVGLCLVPVALAYAGPGLAALAVVTLGHVLIDRWKVRLTRHAEAVALADAHRRHEDSGSGTGLGPAWTPLPGALFIVDQAAHLALLGGAWLVLLSHQPLHPDFVAVVDRALGPLDRSAFHAGVVVAVVLLALLIVNVRAAALFVAVLVRPRESMASADPADELPATTTAPRAWRLRLGGLVATAEPLDRARAGDAATPGIHASPARLGATIGVLERLLIVTLVLTGSTAAIGFIVAAKTLARFRQLDDRDFAEYYLLGTLASVAVALASGLVAAAALSTIG